MGDTKMMHMYKAFRTLEEAKAFHKGILLTPRSRGDRRYEYEVLAAEYVDTDKYPYIRVWNERAK
jgi:hypothetical protein